MREKIPNLSPTRDACKLEIKKFPVWYIASRPYKPTDSENTVFEGTELIAFMHLLKSRSAVQLSMGGFFILTHTFPDCACIITHIAVGRV